jgi:hypothetical protein
MLRMNFVGKPCAGKPHARFEEGGREPCLYSTLTGKMALTENFISLLAKSGNASILAGI